MAVNPQLFPNGMPVPFVNEMFVLARDGVEFEVDKIPRLASFHRSPFYIRDSYSIQSSLFTFVLQSFHLQLPIYVNNNFSRIGIAIIRLSGFLFVGEKWGYYILTLPVPNGFKYFRPI